VFNLGLETQVLKESSEVRGEKGPYDIRHEPSSSSQFELVSRRAACRHLQTS